jgi:molybdopterin converting factor small subunit
MKLTINMIGVEIKLKEQVSLEPSFSALRDVVRVLKKRDNRELRRFVGDDLAPVDGSAILVNGRNILSLERWETQIHDGDEITFMVPVAGG